MLERELYNQYFIKAMLGFTQAYANSPPSDGPAAGEVAA
jgi:hypothetical protein